LHRSHLHTLEYKHMLHIGGEGARTQNKKQRESATLLHVAPTAANETRQESERGKRDSFGCTERVGPVGLFWSARSMRDSL
jgi:hypothetical protein